MNNKNTYTFWQHIKHAVVIGGGFGIIIKSIFVLAGCGAPLTPLRVIVYSSILLAYVPGIPWYVHKAFFKE